MMTEYRGFASYLTQMSVASLILPIFFIRDIMGVPENESIGDHINLYIILSWVLLFTAIGSGIWYQYVATKKIIEGTGKRIRRPVLFFGIMLGAFYLGIGFFILSIIFSV